MTLPVPGMGGSRGAPWAPISRGTLGVVPALSGGGWSPSLGWLRFYPGPFWGAGGHALSLEGVGVSFGGVPPVIPTLPAVRGAGPSGPPAGAL